MDQIKPAVELKLDETPEQDTKARDLRTLSDLELVLCGGGDGHINW